MQVNINQKVAEKTTSVNPQKGKVIIAQNLVRERELLDKDGNVIDNFKTRNIIKKAEDNK